MQYMSAGKNSFKGQHSINDIRISYESYLPLSTHDPEEKGRNEPERAIAKSPPNQHTNEMTGVLCHESPFIKLSEALSSVFSASDI
jgi:hypothetical protein